MATDEAMATAGAIALLGDAIYKEQKACREALDRLREAAPPEAYDGILALRTAIELAGCLRRMLPGRTLREIHDAFGAPGDFGYETPIGAALARLYLEGR